MDILTQQIPGFSTKEATALACELFGIRVTARPLPSERDQTFLLETSTGPEFVLKIANASEDRAVLEAQNAALEHLALQDPSIQCPRVRVSKTGDRIGLAQGADGSAHFVRMLSYVPGHLLVHTNPYTPELLRSLGEFFGGLDHALLGFSHPVLKRELHWDLRQASEVISIYIEHVPDPDRRSLVEHFRKRFQEFVEPTLTNLRTSVIHNDGNDYNILVADIQNLGGKVTGLIDFGDLVESCTLFELAICTAYAVLGKHDPLTAAAQVVSGYHSVYPLTEQDLELLYDLIATRLCTSVCMSAYQKKRHPDNAYLVVSEGPAWKAVKRWANISPRLAHYTFRHACGMLPCTRTSLMVNWLETNTKAIGSVVKPEISNSDYLVFDLAAGSAELADVPDPTDSQILTNALSDRLRAAGVRVGIGRYNEARRSYTGKLYQPVGSEIDDWRTIHLGIDLFIAAGSAVFAPLDGTVHSFHDNDQPFDYGPTVILRHRVESETEFFTLYGHLSQESLKWLSEGQFIPKGSQIGTIGDSTVNGNWPPHLHFQIITDLLNFAGDYPGVCTDRDRELWMSLCPDPNLILQVPNFPTSRAERTPEEILEARRRHIGKSLSVSFEKPLKLVQGWKQYVYDHLGREFLDAVNNVCHVGHCHPAVVQAADRQMSLLNTNTRFLHDKLVEYAERLCATLPEPLRVCYFVCSGSEANELALRLAKAHTNATDMIVVDGGYHGNTTSLVDISPYKFKGQGGTGAPPSVHTVMMPDRYRGPYQDERDAGRIYALQVHEAIEHTERNGRKVAAFICETMLSCGGQIVLPPHYLSEAYRYIRTAGGVCIADEIQVGFGRVGTHFWGFQTQDVVPDIVTMGKPMGNGHPIGAVVTTPEIAESFATGMEYFNTFGGTPVSCAIGLAVLNVIEREGLQHNALTVGGYLKKELQQMMPTHPMIGDVRGDGLFLGIELVCDRETREPAGIEASYISERMKQFGVLVSTDGPFHNVLKIKPPMVFTKADADRFTTALDSVLSEPRLKLLKTPP